MTCGGVSDFRLPLCSGTFNGSRWGKGKFALVCTLQLAVIFETQGVGILVE